MKFHSLRSNKDDYCPTKHIHLSNENMIQYLGNFELWVTVFFSGHAYSINRKCRTGALLKNYG